MINFYKESISQYLLDMKLLKTIHRLIQESENKYLSAQDSDLSIDELDRLEKNYHDSLKLLKIFESIYPKKMN